MAIKRVLIDFVAREPAVTHMEDLRAAVNHAAYGPYARQRAAGSLGGASRWGTIVLRNGSYYERVR